MSYENLKEQAEEEIELEKLAYIKSQIKSRLERKKILMNEIKLIDKEIKAFIKDGKIENLKDYIKIDSIDAKNFTGIAITNSN